MNLGWVFFFGAMMIIAWNYMRDIVDNLWISMPIGVAMYVTLLWYLNRKFKVVNK